MARQISARPGSAFNLTETQEEGTSSGSPLIRPAARVTASNTKFGPREDATSADSAVPPTAGPRGKRRSAFLTFPNGELSTWQPTAICLLVVDRHSAASFGAFARAMHRTQMSRPLLTKSLPLILAGACCLALRSIQADSPARFSWQWTALAR